MSNDRKAPTLSRRQAQVALLLGRGLDGNAIGAELSISPLTVKKHAAVARRKTRARNAAHLAVMVALAQRQAREETAMLERVRASLKARAEGRDEGGDVVVMQLVTEIVKREGFRRERA